MVLPTAKKITYIVNLKRVIMRRLVLGIADGIGIMKVDGKVIYEARGCGLACSRTLPPPWPRIPPRRLRSSPASRFS